MIAVTGPTGSIGRQLIALLDAEDAPVRLLVRDPRRTGRGDAVAADLDDPASLDGAWAGADRLFLLSPGPDTPAQDAAAIAAAGRAGVEHVVLLSSLGVDVGGVGGGRPHLPGEEALKASGLGWTILRPSEFMTNTLGFLPELHAAGTVSVPSGTGRVGFVAPADIAAVACAALTQPRHQERVYRPTGPAALSIADVAGVLGEVAGVPARHVDMSTEAFRAAAGAAGKPAPMIELLTEYYEAVAAGRMGLVSTDVQTVTGRPATSFADWARTSVPAA